jgi:3D (Asp-Asp-Asp) domain-containing protein
MTSRTQVEEKEIPFDIQYVESDTLLPGMSQIQEEGDNGVLRQVVKTFEVGGQPIDQQVQSSYELKRPKKRVVIRNSKPVVGESFELTKLKISQTLQVEATAYTYTGDKTATGIAAREGLIAVDPKVIAMGSKVYVEGYGYALAADTGGDIRGNRIDVFFATFRQCINWGRRQVHIYVLNPN